MLAALRKKLKQSSEVKIVREPLSELMQKILLVLVFSVSLFASFYAGKYWSSSIAYKVEALSKENALLQAQLNSEKVKAAANRLDNEAMDKAVESVRKSNADLRQQISDLQEEVTYYQRVMNPISNDKGLRIDTVDFESSTDPNRFRINAVLTQLGKQNRTVILGVLDIHIEGSENGEKKVYELESLKVADRDLQTRFRFRYYQDISEEIAIPEGFSPEKVHFTAKASGSKAMEIQRTEDWPF